MKLTPEQRDDELKVLIEKYNKIRETYLVVYAAATVKPAPAPELNSEDYKLLCDLLKDVDATSLDVYIETPGGYGEVAEEIVRFMRGKFEKVSFVVAGEAKSAGTILVLSGDEILMADTGSLGPIDAQVMIGRSMVSANDYLELVNARKKEADQTGILPAMEATVIAQVSPGELEQVYNALEFAKDLVKEWLTKYKYRDWDVTEKRGLPVTEQMKKDRAGEIAEVLTDTHRWRTHGRSIKREDLEEIGLRITRVDDDKDLADIVYRLQMLIALIMSSTSIYKILCTAEGAVNRQAMPIGMPQATMPQPTAVEVNHQCPRCCKKYKYYLKLKNDPAIDKDMQEKGRKPLPQEVVKCTCGLEIPVDKIRAETERTIGIKPI